MKDLGHKPTKLSSKTVSDIHSEKKLPIRIIENIQISIRKVKASVNMNIINAHNYIIIVETDWLIKVKTKIKFDSP